LWNTRRRIPNIFIGYHENENDKYKYCEDILVDQLFFGIEHNCELIQKKQYIYTNKLLNIKNELKSFDPIVVPNIEKIKFLYECLNNKNLMEDYKKNIEIFKIEIANIEGKNGEMPKKFDEYEKNDKIKSELIKKINLYYIYKKDLEEIKTRVIPSNILQISQDTIVVEEKIEAKDISVLIAKNTENMNGDDKNMHYSKIDNLLNNITKTIEKYVKEKTELADASPLKEDVNKIIKDQYGNVYKRSILSYNDSKNHHKYLKYKTKYEKLKMSLRQNQHKAK